MPNSASYLGVYVNQGKGYSEQYTAAALQEEDVPHPEAAFQGEAVHEYAQEPVCADTGNIHPMPFQMCAQARKAIIH